MTASHATGRRLRLWYTRCPVPTGLGIAIHLGLLDQAFLGDPEAELVLLQSAADPGVLQAHFTHAEPNVFRQGGNYPAIWARSNGADTRVIGLSYVRGPQTVLALPESGIRSAADLKGKRLLLQRRPHEPIDFVYATALRTYERALASAGLSLDDVTLVVQEQSRGFIADSRSPLASQAGCAGTVAPAGRYTDLLFPLIRGEVDAIASGTIGSPTIQLEFLFGLRRVFDLFDLQDELLRANNSTPLVLAVNGDLVERRPDLVERLLVAVLEAEDWAASNPLEALRLVAREQTTAERFAGEAFASDLQRTLALDFDPLKVAALHAQHDYLDQLGFLPRRFDVDAWLAPEPLARARRTLRERTFAARSLP
ncbi:ABC transporter substrate-binding protein [Zoogloea sp. LCSB751]|uniref:ABC transporter substrate-binding protein n=1 Tax=Zoogloea sp. LCSB751 TaxID=1965277 RepID=UPI0009A53CE5|nr:ABC transporter substrate-binding protein [Zoogloea sp. LCSB751]